MQLRLAQIVADTEAEGPGRRFALWVQGCSLRCPGCCNPEMFAADKGRAADSAELAAQALATAGLEGVSVLGGEPGEQAEAVADFCEMVRAGGLSVMLYSGYTLAELRARPGAERLLKAVDLLVDGRYQQSLPETRRRWLGSTNQVMHFLTPRYSLADPRFASANTVELRLTRDGLTINGWPAAADGVRWRTSR
ncbi:MAG: radical protein [Myxococcaceae bacterium]|nr:radical protein [Myxococcaceae bacterium]